MKNHLKTLKYEERKSLSAHQKSDFDINTIRPLPSGFIAIIKPKLPLLENIELSDAFERLRIDAAIVEMRDRTIPRTSERNRLLQKLGGSIKTVIENMENLDDYTYREYTDNNLLNTLEKLHTRLEQTDFTKDTGGPKPKNLKLFIVYWLLSIFQRGTNQRVSISHDAYNDSYYGDAFDFLSICNEWLKLDLGSPSAIVKLARFYTDNQP